ncbi:hypothetical protein ANO14919_011950 [Xylariales sp. No.14919]|nr:hypothetical protein ANO14919_011950 [Xylariales sp. No.14919]
MISRSATRKRVAAEEAIRNQGKERMARTVQGLVREAQAKLRTALSAELGKIASDTEKKLEAIRQASQRQQGNHDETVKNKYTPLDENNFISELLRASADILQQYHILEEEPHDNKSHEYSPSATLEPDDRDDTLKDVVGLMQRSLSPPPSIGRELIQPSASPPADAKEKFGANHKSDDDKDWLRDDDGKTSDEEELDRERNGTVPQERSADLPRYGVQSGDLGSGRVPSPSLHDVRRTLRNSQRRSSRKIVIDSDEESSEASNSISDIHKEFRSRRPLRLPSPRPTLRDRRLCSQVLRPSSLPIMARERSKSPFSPKKAVNLKEDGELYRWRCRRQPTRRSTTVPFTYNVKAIFKNQVGSLYSPEHRLIESAYQ